MSGHEDGQPAGGAAMQFVPEFATGSWIDAGGRLVEKEKLGVRERAGAKRQPLLPPAGQLAGELLFSAGELRDWQHVLEERLTRFGELGIPYQFLVPPNAHPVYPEDLPDEIREAEIRPIHQLMRHLESGSPARLVYPLDDILAAKPNPHLYSKTDTHWAGQAAFIAYRRLVEEIDGAVTMHVVPEEEVLYHEEMAMGELGYKVDPKETSVQVMPIVLRPSVRPVSDNRVINRGMKLVSECPEAPQATCLVFGDSFTLLLLPMLGASFRRLVFLHSPTVDFQLVQEEQPDLVVSVLNERFLMSIPSDADAPTAHELESEKRAQGLLRSEDWYWPP
jgi:hypothetical protein